MDESFVSNPTLKSVSWHETVKKTGIPKTCTPEHTRFPEEDADPEHGPKSLEERNLGIILSRSFCLECSPSGGPGVGQREAWQNTRKGRGHRPREAERPRKRIKKLDESLLVV